MGAAFAIGAGKAKVETDTSVGRNASIGASFEALRKKIRNVWPVKCAQQVAARTGISQRSVERFMAGENELSSAAIIHLLRSEHGLHFLVCLMEKSRPAWWSNLLRLGMRGSVERRREADRRLLERIADADRDVATRLPAATYVPDEEFYQPFAEAVASFTETGESGGALGRGPRR